MMRIVEYMNQNGNPSGRYAKRFTIGFEEILVPRTILDAQTGQIKQEFVIEKVEKYRDEIIPIRYFCVCDPEGAIKLAMEIRFSQEIELSGKKHPFNLNPGEECHLIPGSQCDEMRIESALNGYDEFIRYILDHKKLGPRDETGKRQIIEK